MWSNGVFCDSDKVHARLVQQVPMSGLKHCQFAVVSYKDVLHCIYGMFT